MMTSVEAQKFSSYILVLSFGGSFDACMYISRPPAARFLQSSNDDFVSSHLATSPKAKNRSRPRLGEAKWCQRSCRIQVTHFTQARETLPTRQTKRQHELRNTGN